MCERKAAEWLINMLNPYFSLCVYLSEMVISYLFFSAIFEGHYSQLKSLMIGGILFTSASAVNLIFQNNGVINVFATFAVNVMFAQICYDSSLPKSLFYSAILGIINVALEVAVVFISSLITSQEFLDYNNNFILLLFQAITIKALYFLTTLILVKVLRPEENHGTIPIEFLIYPIIATVCQSIFWYICSQPEISYHVQFLLCTASICLFISSILLFVSYSHQVKKDKQALQVKSELSRLQTEQTYYQILDLQNQQLMIYAHDAKKHLAAIQALNENPQITNYVTKLSEQLADYSRNCHSGNKMLDIMIHKYTVDCEMRGIQFEYDVRVCNLAQLDDMDLVTILGNLMDNAIAAAEQSTDKTINLNTVHRNSYSVIVISNSCDTPPKQSGNRLISTKQDNGMHGFGLRSVKKTITKYQGDYEWNYDEKEGSFTVTLMLREPSPLR